jgi:hypothetical protein
MISMSITLALRIKIVVVSGKSRGAKPRHYLQGDRWVGKPTGDFLP